MYPDTHQADLPSGWATGLTPDETAMLQRHLHDLAHLDDLEDTSH